MSSVLKILFEDKDLLVIDKPPGIVVTPADSDQNETISDILTKDYKITLDRGGVVHRLDKDTSGILLAAKNLDSFTTLQEQFKSRNVQKEYLALVHGFIEKEGEIDAPIGRNPKDREKFVVLQGSREAQTKYIPIQKYLMSQEKIAENFPDYSKIQLKKLSNMQYSQFTLLQCHPLTGRTHQIRVHLKYLGHPIVGDSKYGGRKITRLDHRLLKRQFLHANRIEFYHPKSGEKIVFESPLPDDLKDALANLKIVN